MSIFYIFGILWKTICHGKLLVGYLKSYLRSPLRRHSINKYLKFIFVLRLDYPLLLVGCLKFYLRNPLRERELIINYLDDLVFNIESSSVSNASVKINKAPHQHYICTESSVIFLIVSTCFAAINLINVTL